MRAALLILRFTVCALLTALFCVDDWVSGLAPRSGQRPALESPQVRVVADGESHLPADRCRKMIVGPGGNLPSVSEMGACSSLSTLATGIFRGRRHCP